MISIKTNQDLTFNVPLSYEAHSIAEKCRQGISNTQKAKQVYLNTLAVYVVNYYLECMGFETDWENSYSRNPLLIKLTNVADLILPHLGKLECRPVLPNAEFFDIPEEVSEERIAYIAVQFKPSLKEATILGFTRQSAQKIPLNQLSNLETFLEYLMALESEQSKTQPVLVKLGDWLEGIIDLVGWQTVEQLLNPQQLQFREAFRDKMSVTRCQKIDLVMELNQNSLVLVIEVTSDNQNTVNIVAEVHPLKKDYLIEGVKLSIKDEVGNTLEAISRERDNWIQLEFTAEKEEKFSVTIALRNAEITKQFCV